MYLCPSCKKNRALADGENTGLLELSLQNVLCAEMAAIFQRSMEVKYTCYY